MAGGLGAEVSFEVGFEESAQRLVDALGRLEVASRDLGDTFAWFHVCLAMKVQGWHPAHWFFVP